MSVHRCGFWKRVAPVWDELEGIHDFSISKSYATSRRTIWKIDSTAWFLIYQSFTGNSYCCLGNNRLGSCSEFLSPVQTYISWFSECICTRYFSSSNLNITIAAFLLTPLLHVISLGTKGSFLISFLVFIILGVEEAKSYILPYNLVIKIKMAQTVYVYF